MLTAQDLKFERENESHAAPPCAERAAAKHQTAQQAESRKSVAWSRGTLEPTLTATAFGRIRGMNSATARVFPLALHRAGTHQPIFTCRMLV